MTSKETLKILVSDTRRDIIKELSNGYRTPSDLSKMLGKSKSTIVEHLEKLTKAGMVEKMERPGRKWVFYSLTRQGQSLVPKRDDRIIVILSIVFLSLIGGTFSLYTYLQPYGMMAQKSLETMVEREQQILILTRNQVFLYVAIGLFIVSIIGIFGLMLMKRKRMVDI